MVTTSSTLSYERQTVPPIIQAVQGDTGRNISFTISDYEIPEGASAAFYIQKPSGEAVYNTAEIVSSNVVNVPLDAQCLAEVGENYGQVRILLDDEVVTSFGFILLVKTFYGIEAIESHTEMNIFDEAVEEAKAEIEATFADELQWDTSKYNRPYIVRGTGANSTLENRATESSGYDSHAEGYHTKATNDSAHAEGSSTTASGYASHAEGNNTTASNQYAHSEGASTTASGQNSHAEGYSTTASGGSSHAEGQQTVASAAFSHAQNRGTIANHISQTVLGEYNEPDPSSAASGQRGNYVEIVGNGTADNARSNARTLDWSGNEKLSGDLTVFAGSSNETSISDLKQEYNQLYEEWVGKNKIPPTSITNGAYISDNTGTLSENSGYFYTDFIEIDAEQDYVFSAWYTGSQQSQATRYIWLFYDADKSPISVSYVNSAAGRYITAQSPSNAKYIKVSSTIITPISGSEIVYQLEKGTVPSSPSTYNIYKVLNDNSNILMHKKWVACGDSFTHGDFTGGSDDGILDYGKYASQNKVYPFIIGNRNNMTIVNEAVNGSTMCLNDGTHNAFSTANGRYTQIPDDADYITLYFGINDGNYSSPVGTIDDDDNTTFYGAWNVVLEYLITNHPFAKIGIIVTNGTSMAYINATKAIAEKWGIPYLDMNGVQTPMMNRSNNQSASSTVKDMRNQIFSVDYPTNTHPSPKAHEYESTFIEAFLRRL